MAGRCALAIWSALPPIRRWLFQSCRFGSKPETPFLTVATASSMPMRWIKRGRLFTRSRKQYQGKVYAGRVARSRGAGVLIAPGRRITPLDLLLARAGGLHKLNVRRPRLRVVNIPPSAGEPVTAKLIVDCARAAGADVTELEAGGRDVAAIATALDASECDLLIIIGGSGVGRSDAAIAALARCGQVIAHGVALQPGRTTAVGRVGNVPLVALPGAPDHALAAWWTLAMPALERLSGLSARRGLTLPLLRKIASSVGITDMVLLQNTENGWMPLATGDISLDAMARADAWLMVPAASEGFAAGSVVAAYMLRE